MHERDGQTDRQTDRWTLHDSIDRACIASCGKNNLKTCLFVLTECKNVTDRQMDRHRMMAKSLLTPFWSKGRKSASPCLV